MSFSFSSNCYRVIKNIPSKEITDQFVKQPILVTSFSNKKKIHIAPNIPSFKISLKEHNQLAISHTSTYEIKASITLYPYDQKTTEEKNERQPIP
jgi:hypothetical protein